MLGLAETLLQGLLQLLYVIFIKGSLILINSLYKIFLFFSGNEFSNHIIGTDPNGSFSIDWNSPISTIFFYVMIACLVLGLLVIGFIFAQRLLSTKINDGKTYAGLGAIPKYFVTFLLGSVGIPVFFLFMNLIITVLSSILGFTNSINVGNDGILQINNHIIGMGNSLGNIKNVVIGSSNIDLYLNNLLNDLQAEINSSTSDQFTQELKNLMEKIQLFRTELALVEQNKTTLLELLNSIKPDKIDANLSSQLMSQINYLSDFLTKYETLNSQINNTISNYSTNFLDNNVLLRIKEFQLSAGNSTDGLGFYFGNKGLIYKLINGDINQMGLFNLKMRVSGSQDFVLVLQLYRLITGDQTGLNWNHVPSKIDTGMILTGILTCLISLGIMFMYCLYVTKRIFVLSIYFVASPIVLILGMKDDGYTASNFFKTWIVKFFSILIITLTMQVSLLITTGNYGISTLINQWEMDKLIKDIAGIILIIAALVAGYSTASMLSKMLGDDSSVMESMHDLMLISRTLPLAAAPMQAGFKMFKRGIGSTIGATNKISPLTSMGKVSEYSNRMRTLSGLTQKPTKISDVNSYRKYRSALKGAVKQ